MNQLPFGVLDVVMAVAAAALVAWLVREIVRPRWRLTRIRTARVRLPSTSGVDFLSDAALIAIGIALSTTGSELNFIGCGVVSIPAGLACLRLGFRRNRPIAAR